MFMLDTMTLLDSTSNRNFLDSNNAMTVNFLFYWNLFC